MEPSSISILCVWWCSRLRVLVEQVSGVQMTAILYCSPRSFYPDSAARTMLCWAHLGILYFISSCNVSEDFCKSWKVHLRQQLVPLIKVGKQRYTAVFLVTLLIVSVPLCFLQVILSLTVSFSSPCEWTVTHRVQCVPLEVSVHQCRLSILPPCPSFAIVLLDFVS